MIGKLELYPLSDLAKIDFPPTRFIVPSLLPEGLSLLVGPPKAGKSWLALDIALAVATGSTVLGTKDCTKGSVAYLAMEDSQRRIKWRVAELRGRRFDLPSNLAVSHKEVKLKDGLCQALLEWIGSTKNPRLIVIDTLQKIRSMRKSATDLYAEDVETLSKLQELTKRFRISILCLHHRRKAPAEDKIDTVSGTLGVPGTVDSILLLDRPRFRREGRLWLTGRDIEEAEYALDIEDTFTWKLRGYARRGSAMSHERLSVFKTLEDFGPMSISQIAGALDKTRDAIKQLIASMLRDGQVKRVDRGQYAAACLDVKGSFSWDEVPEWASDLVQDLP
jgi:hypothetical protein